MKFLYKYYLIIIVLLITWFFVSRELTFFEAFVLLQLVIMSDKIDKYISSKKVIPIKEESA